MAKGVARITERIAGMAKEIKALIEYGP